jgi:hypothetical protein
VYLFLDVRQAGFWVEAVNFIGVPINRRSTGSQITHISAFRCHGFAFEANTINIFVPFSSIQSHQTASSEAISTKMLNRQILGPDAQCYFLKGGAEYCIYGARNVRTRGKGIEC